MRYQRCRPVALAIVLASSAALVSCASMSETDERVATGAGVGAATGAIVGSMTGSWAWGAVGGAALGAGGGYLYDKHKKDEERKQDEAYQQGYEAGQKAQ